MVQNQTSVLFVCMGNICRSPTAEAVFKNIVAKRGYVNSINADSAGTHAYHIGEEPDRRSQATALQRGVDMSDQRSRIVTHDDFKSFDYIIAMDKSNYNNLLAQSEKKYHKKIHLLLTFSDDMDETEVPDPYYGGSLGFDRVFDMIESASKGLLNNIISI